MRTITLITLALTLGCSGKTENAVTSPGEDGAAGEGGEEGAPGEDGAPGVDGEDGLDCWDTNGDGEPNPEEDINGDGVVDVEDCRGDGVGGDDTGSSSRPDVVQIVAGDSIFCTLFETGQVYCWGSSQGAAHNPDETFEFLAGSLKGAALTCGITTDDDLVCWGNEDLPTYASIPSTSYEYVAVDQQDICAIQTGGEIICAFSSGVDLVPAPDESFSQVSVSSHTACGVTDSGSIECWGLSGVTLESLTPPPSGAFETVDIGFAWGCALSVMGTIECWSDATEEISGTVTNGILEPPEGTFTSLSLGRAHACAIDEHNEAVCWGDNGSGQLNVPLFSRFESLAAGNSRTCGITLENEVHCWGGGIDGPTIIDL